MTGDESVTAPAMASTVARLRRRSLPWRRAAAPLVEADDSPTVQVGEVPPVDLALNDPLYAYLQSANGVVDVEALELDSPGVSAMRAAGVKLAVPLVSRGELVGVLNLGPRRSDRDYSTDDRRLLEALAGQAAPAVRVGQLIRQQEREAQVRQRLKQELEVARLIQQNFLPKTLPDLPEWEVGAFYRPAQEVGGDFYDVIPLRDGQVGFVVGDVTDKGVPAALVMAATRSVLRATAERLVDPSTVLERVNEHLCPDMPAKMFVTCLYGVLEPDTGRFRFANAGHNLPYVKRAERSVELRATGMPLGLMPGMTYEESETVLAHGETLLLHSDGVVEAHDQAGRMFGFPSLKEAVGRHPTGRVLIDLVLRDLAEHTGPKWQQEDDITMLSLSRSDAAPPDSGGRESQSGQTLEFDVPSIEGNERSVMETVVAIVGPLGLSDARLKRLGTAVAEATMNAMEHGNLYDAEQPVTVRVSTGPLEVRVHVVDHGAGSSSAGYVAPDIEAKLAGRQRPRGWGLFLIREMVDEAHEYTDGTRHIQELVMRLGDETANRSERGHDEN